MRGMLCGRHLGLLAVLAIFFTAGQCSTDDFLGSLKSSGFSYWSSLLNDTGLAQEYAKGFLTRYGMFLVPSDSALQSAFQQAQQGGATNQQWLNWASKVITYHYLEDRLGYSHSTWKYTSKTWQPIYPEKSWLRVEVHKESSHGYEMRAVADSGIYADFIAGECVHYGGMCSYAIDKVLLPKGIEPPEHVADTEPPEPFMPPVYNSTADFLTHLQNVGSSRLAQLITEAQLEDTFVQNDMTLFGTLFAPSDLAIDVAFSNVMFSGASYQQWLDWGSKVIPYHTLLNKLDDCAGLKDCVHTYFPVSPGGSFLTWEYIVDFSAKERYEVISDADPPAKVKVGWPCQEFKGIDICSIDQLLVPFGYPLPSGSNLDYSDTRNFTVA